MPSDDPLKDLPESAPASVPAISSIAAPGIEPEITRQFGNKGPSIVLQTAFGVSQQPSVPDTIASKLTPEHISSALNEYAKDKERKQETTKLGMYLAFASLVGVLLFVLFLCWMFLQFNKPELLEKIIALIIGLFGGGVTGFGIGRGTTAKKEG
jgi:hypothetical protein